MIPGRRRRTGTGLRWRSSTRWAIRTMRRTGARAWSTAAHLGMAGTFAEGDFDFSGTVNSADQAILNAQLKLWLPPPGALSLPASGGDDSQRLHRESASLMEIFAGTDVAPTYRLILGAVTS